MANATIIASSSYANDYNADNVRQKDGSWRSSKLYWGPFQKESLTVVLDAEYAIDFMSIDWLSDFQLYAIYAKDSNGGDWFNIDYYLQMDNYKAVIPMNGIKISQIQIVSIGGFGGYFEIGQLELTVK